MQIKQIYEYIIAKRLIYFKEEMKEGKKIGNWSEYNKGLKERGVISIRITEEEVNNWYEQEKRIGKGKRNVYSDIVIKLMLIIGQAYHLPYRQTEGFMRHLVELQGLSEKIKVPQYNILSRRAKDINIKSEIEKIARLQSKGGRIEIALDGSGIKIYGEHEWKVKTHGKGKKRKWKKTHVVIDLKTLQVTAIYTTNSSVHDGSMFVKLVRDSKKTGDITVCYADEACTWHEHFDCLERNGIKARIPLPKNAVIEKEDKDEAIMLKRARDKAIIEIYDSGGVNKWKKSSGYHKRSLIENFFSRFKTIFTEKVRARLCCVQNSVLLVRSLLLNKFAATCMPKYM